MIIREFFLTRKDGVNLYRTYSDEGFYIRKMYTDEVYTEAIDVEDAYFEYVETDILLPIEENENIEEGETESMSIEY